MDGGVKRDGQRRVLWQGKRGVNEGGKFAAFDANSQGPGVKECCYLLEAGKGK